MNGVVGECVIRQSTIYVVDEVIITVMLSLKPVCELNTNRVSCSRQFVSSGDELRIKLQVLSENALYGTPCQVLQLNDRFLRVIHPKLVHSENVFVTSFITMSPRVLPVSHDEYS